MGKETGALLNPEDPRLAWVTWNVPPILTEGRDLYTPGFTVLHIYLFEMQRLSQLPQGQQRSESLEFLSVTGGRGGGRERGLGSLDCTLKPRRLGGNPEKPSIRRERETPPTKEKIQGRMLCSQAHTPEF